MDEVIQPLNIVIVNAHFSKVMGGSEIQCHQIAGGLQAAGHVPAYVAVGGLGDQAEEYPYQLVNASESGESILQKCLEIQPDVVYWRYNKKHFGKVIPKLKQKGIKVIFSISHIHDLQPFAYKAIDGLGPLARLKRRGKHLISGLSFSRAIKMVDGVVCNNRAHLELIKHPRKIYIPNSPFLEKEDFSWNKPYVVWVGNLKKHKQPERFIEAAREFVKDDIDFLMVGKIQQEAYQYVKDPSQIPSNFHYLGEKDIKKTNGIIANALFLIHTCKPEGFPNVFLQAWGYAKPVISLEFDPDGIIEKERVGAYSRTMDRFKNDIKDLLSEGDKRASMGARAKALLEKTFVKSNNISLLTGFLTD